MPTAIVIQPNGDQARQTLRTLEEFQAVVGGYIEVVSLPECDLYLNEDGIALDLPCNPVATRYAKRELARVGRRLLSADGWILGPVVLIGKPDRDGDETDCPAIDLGGV